MSVTLTLLILVFYNEKGPWSHSKSPKLFVCIPYGIQTVFSRASGQTLTVFSLVATAASGTCTVGEGQSFIL